MAAVTGPNSTGDCGSSPEEILSRMVAQYQGALLRMCCLCLRDRNSAEDAVQETFIKAYRSIDTFRARSTERTWLMSIAINTCRDMNKSAWFRHTERRITPEEMTIPVPPQDEESLALAEAIRRLPARLRDVILLYYYQDMTIQEVAEALHAAPSTIAKRLSQARSRLHDLLGEDEALPRPASERRVI